MKNYFRVSSLLMLFSLLSCQDHAFSDALLNGTENEVKTRGEDYFILPDDAIDITTVDGVIEAGKVYVITGEWTGEIKGNYWQDPETVSRLFVQGKWNAKNPSLKEPLDIIVLKEGKVYFCQDNSVNTYYDLTKPLKVNIFNFGNIGWSNRRNFFDASQYEIIHYRDN